AEHGYSLLLTVERGGRPHSILYNGGFTLRPAFHNPDVLGDKGKELRAIALSHGHADHHGGLAGLVNRVGRRGLPLVLHPDAWLDRKLVFSARPEMPRHPPWKFRRPGRARVPPSPSKPHGPRA